VHEGFRHETAAIRAEVPGGVRNGCCRTHARKVMDKRAGVEEDEYRVMDVFPGLWIVTSRL
jgi:hypothetical protein